MENNEEKIEQEKKGEFLQEEFEKFLKEKNISPEHTESLKQKFKEFLDILKDDPLVKDLKITEEDVVKIVKDLIYRYFLKKE